MLSIIMILVTAIGICLFVVRIGSTIYYQELLNHGKAIADTTAKNCEYGLYTANQAALITVVDSLSVDSTIAYVSVENRKHQELAGRTFGNLSSLPNSNLHDGALESVYVHDVTDALSGKNYIEIYWPVHSTENNFISDIFSNKETLQNKPQIIGHLRLGLSEEGLKKRSRELLISISIFTSILVLCGSGLSIPLSRRLTSPLEQLRAATRDVAEGKFDSPIEVRTYDEIADLARSFDHMRHRLGEYHDQVQQHTDELVSSNKKLTAEIDARKTMEKQLQHDALHDALTGLPNRTLFADRLNHAMHLLGRNKKYVYAVLFLDLDRFKVINDSLGHLIGDKLLIAFGQRLTSCLRPHDTVARLGGDEFAVLLEDIGGLSNATYIAERIGTALRSSFMIGEQEVFTSSSIGIALGSSVYTQPEQILRDADTAMYEAKSGGRARFAIFEPGMHADALARMKLETELRRATERGEFVSYYQPIYSLSSNRLAGFEALARWNHPEQGIINPGTFVKMAEETGLIVAIDRLVLQEACRQMVELLKLSPGNSLDFISVNLSNKQMVQPDLVDYVKKVLGETGLAAGALKLEITENVIIENPEQTLHMLSRLKALGVQLYIDDFGTGYSSLSYLHRLPIDGLKIDRSFISDMGENGENQQIVRTIILLAHDMKIDVIAEGVETPIQLAQIKMLDCEYAQGYLFSKPVVSGKAAELVKQGYHKAVDAKKPVSV